MSNRISHFHFICFLAENAASSKRAGNKLHQLHEIFFFSKFNGRTEYADMALLHLRIKSRNDFINTLRSGKIWKFKSYQEPLLNNWLWHSNSHIGTRMNGYITTSTGDMASHSVSYFLQQMCVTRYTLVYYFTVLMTRECYSNMLLMLAQVYINITRSKFRQNTIECIRYQYVNMCDFGRPCSRFSF